jgi:hypothetical protein
MLGDLPHGSLRIAYIVACNYVSVNMIFEAPHVRSPEKFPPPIAKKREVWYNVSGT